MTDALTGIVRAAQIVSDATRVKYGRCRLLLESLTPAEREAYLDRIDAIPDDALADVGEQLCVFCLATMHGGGKCPQGCATLYVLGTKKRDLGAYFRNRTRDLAVKEGQNR